MDDVAFDEVPTDDAPEVHAEAPGPLGDDEDGIEPVQAEDDRDAGRDDPEPGTEANP